MAIHRSFFIRSGAAGLRETPAAAPVGRRRRRIASGLLLLGGALLATPAPAQDDGQELVRRINDHREAPQRCEGRQTAPVGPLAPVPALERLRPAQGAELQRALKDQGYLAAQVQVVTVDGPTEAGAVMALLRRKHCGLLSNPRFAEIGVSREGRTWRIVFAQPLLDRELGDWREAGRAVLEQVNAARAEPRRCGTAQLQAAAPLAWSEHLAAAARAHSEDMARRNYFNHRAPDGSRAADRATQQGYRWQRIGENIATGQGGPQQVVSGWLASPGHCRNLMDPAYTEMGAAYAVNPGSDTSIYWTQVFGTPLPASRP